MESESRKEMESESRKEMESESSKEMESVDHQAELLTLHEEIMSLVSERNNLLASLTPNLFVWEDQSAAARWADLNSREVESASTWRIAGKASVQKMDSSLTEPAAVSGSRPTWQPEQLENYWDSILQDMEDLGHRMLSIADDTIHSRKLDGPISMYKKAEMFATASRLVQISQDLSNSTNAAVGGQAEEMVTEAVDSCEKKVAATFARLAREEAFAEDARGEARARDARGQAHAEENIALSNGFLRLCNNYFERPNTYRKHLAMIITPEEDREMEMEKEKEKEKEMEKAKAVEKEKEKEKAKAKAVEKEKEKAKAMAKAMAKEKAKAMMKEKAKAMAMAKAKGTSESKAKEEQEKGKGKEQGKGNGKVKGKGKGKGEKKRQDKEEEEDEEEDYDGVFWEETESKEYLKRRMVIEQGMFNNHRVGWEYIWGNKIGLCGGFQDTTTLSSMQFTHSTPGIIPHGSVVGTTLQIYSLEIKLKADLEWPLHVYGVVAARDTVDRNRNLLFCRSRVNHQVLTRNDPFLRLTGPGRAILALYPVDFEVELKMIDGDESRDIALISLNLRYNGHDNIALFNSSLCTGKLCLEPIDRTVQATIVGVRLATGDRPFKYGARFACSLLGAGSPVEQVLLLDSYGGENTVGADGYFSLSRNVVSVESEGGLQVVIQAYSGSATISAEGAVSFYRPKHCNIQQLKCYVGDSEVEITVAWSHLVQDKTDLLTEGYAAQVWKAL